VKRACAVCVLALVALSGCSSADETVASGSGSSSTAATASSSPSAVVTPEPVVLLTKAEAAAAYTALITALTPEATAWVTIAMTEDWTQIRAGAPSQAVLYKKLSADLKAIAWPVDVQPVADAAIVQIDASEVAFTAIGAATSDAEAQAVVVPGGSTFQDLAAALGVTL